MSEFISMYVIVYPSKVPVNAILECVQFREGILRTTLITLVKQRPAMAFGRHLYKAHSYFERKAVAVETEHVCLVRE